MATAKDSNPLRKALSDLLKSGSDWEELGIPSTRAVIVKRPAGKTYSANLGLKIPFKGYKGLFFSNLEDVMEFVEDINNSLESICSVMSEVDSINPKSAKKTTNKAKKMLPL